MQKIKQKNTAHYFLFQKKFIFAKKRIVHGGTKKIIDASFFQFF